LKSQGPVKDPELERADFSVSKNIAGFRERKTEERCSSSRDVLATFIFKGENVTVTLLQSLESGARI
jgi:hypothetical protein